MAGGQIGVGEEVTYGTAVAPTDFAEPVNESLQTEHEHARPPVFRSFSTRVIDSLFSDTKGTIEFLANLNGPEGLLLKHFYGSTTKTGSGAPFTHDYPKAAGIPTVDRIGLGLTVEILRANALCWRYAGCKPISWRHDMPLGDFGKITVGFIGKSETLAGPAAATYAALAQQKPVQYTAKFDGGSVLPVRDGSVEMENPVDEPKGWGSATFVAEPDRNGDFSAKVNLNIYFTSVTEYNKFANQADVDVEVKVTQGANSLTYNLNKAKIIQATPHKSGRERLIGAFQLEGQFFDLATECCGATLVNDTATPATYP